MIGAATNALTQLPAADPRDHVLKLRGEVDCSGPTDALPTKLNVTASGYPDYELRTVARESKEHGYTVPLLVAKLRPAAGSFAMDSQKASSVAALNEDFTWQATGTFVGLCSTASGNRWVRAPFWLPREWDLALNRRKAALYLNQGYPLTLDQEYELMLPAGAKPTVLPGVRENDTGLLHWRVEWTNLGDNKLRARFHAELERGELTLAETTGLQKQMRELMAALTEGAVLPPAPKER
jgi:hypothetical protein